MLHFTVHPDELLSHAISADFLRDNRNQFHLLEVAFRSVLRCFIHLFFAFLDANIQFLLFTDLFFHFMWHSLLHNKCFTLFLTSLVCSFPHETQVNVRNVLNQGLFAFLAFLHFNEQNDFPFTFRNDFPQFLQFVVLCTCFEHGLQHFFW